MTPMHQVRTVVRLWTRRFAWFLGVAFIAIAVIHLPHGIVRSAEPIPAPAYVGPPRSDPTEPFLIEPVSAGQPVYQAKWAFQPYWQAVTGYLKVLLTGQLDAHLRQGRIEVWPMIQKGLALSLRTLLTTLAAGLLLGTLVGALSLTSRLGRSISFLFALCGLSVPDFLLIIFGHIMTIWTYSHFGFRLWSIFGDGERGWLPPFLVLTIGTAAYTARLTTAAMDEVLREDYIRTARAKGVPEHRVLLGHALRNALPRVLNGVPAMFNASLSSLIIVELMTLTPGLGSIFARYTSSGTTATIVLIYSVWFLLMDSLTNSLRLLVLPQRTGGAA